MTRRFALQAFVVGCLAWSIGSTLYYTPHWLSYFNELAGGPLGGPEHLLDSNIDWGQDLLFLKKWQERHPEAQPLRAALYSSYDPAILGLKLAEAPPSWPPPAQPDTALRREMFVNDLTPGWYALSVNRLWSRGGEYAYFREHLKPAAYAGYSIYIYHLSEADCREVRRRLGLDRNTSSPPTSTPAE